MLKTKSIFPPKSLTILPFIILVLFMLSSCKKNTPPYKTTGLAMGTVITQSLYGNNSEKVSKDVTKEIDKLEKHFLSWRVKNSDIYNINNTDKFVSVNKFTFNCIKTSLDVSNNCNGLFDITIGNLTGLWNIGEESARVPKKDEIENAIKTINFKNVAVKDNKVKICQGQKIDLGAIGKGAACDELKKLLKEKDINSAVISVGGSILLHGQNPNCDQWSVAIRNPRSTANDYCAVLRLNESCVSTSGDYERVFTKDGVEYHHILNPKTGYPAKSNIISATVVCNSGVLSDALSTVCFMSGFENSKLLLKQFNAEAVLIDKDFNLYVTDGLKSSISITNKNFKLAKG